MTALASPTTGDQAGKQGEQGDAAAHREPGLLFAQQARSLGSLSFLELQLEALVFLAQALQLGVLAFPVVGVQLGSQRVPLLLAGRQASRQVINLRLLCGGRRCGLLRLWRLLLAPGRGFGRLVTGAVGLAMKALSTVLGSQMLADAANFVQSLDATFGGFREKADRTYVLLKRRGTQFVVVSAPEPDALREASFFVDRLSEEHMPLAGLILNRTHPTLCDLHAEKAEETAEELEKKDPNSLTAAVLRIHADRAMTAKREVRLLSRFTGANPHVPIVGVPSLPFDVSDLEALRAIADQITGEASSAA